MITELLNFLKIKPKEKEYGLIDFYCTTCNKWLATIPEEFKEKFKTPCKKCQGWEVSHNFDLYLLRFDQKRYIQYIEKLKKRLIEELS